MQITRQLIEGGSKIARFQTSFSWFRLLYLVIMLYTLGL